MNQTSVHELRCKVMSPTPADNESEVSERIERWVGDVMRLKRVDRATEQLPDQYVLSALRKILTGRTKERVDLKCSRKEEPTMQDVLAMVRTHAHIHRVDLTVRKRNGMHADHAT